MTVSSYYRVIRFGQVEGMWLPMQAEVQSELKWGGGYFSKGESRFKRTSVELNPDHDTSGSFVLEEVPNGATVRITGSDATYSWQDGKVVDGQGFEVSLDPNGPADVPVLMGKGLPSLNVFGLKPPANQTKDRQILVCFWDMQQRPSRHCVHWLNEKAKLLADL